jgi:flagellar hook protein FlgE
VTLSQGATATGAGVSLSFVGSQTNLLSTPGTVTFNTNGTMSTAGGTTPVAINVSNLADGASNMSINWNLFDSNGNGNLTQYDQASALAGSTQDGSAAAELNQVSIQNGGQVVATYSNGQTKVEAQLALASIQNPDTLQNAGNNEFVAGGNTATPAFGLPQTGGRGQIVAGELESSNVDLATQFTDLIMYQSGYQAASKVITTADQMTQELLDLIH